jgi:hypothetical protein
MVARWTSTSDRHPKAAGSSPARDAFLLFCFSFLLRVSSLGVVKVTG